MNIWSLKIKCFPSKSIGDFSFGKNCIVTAAIQVQSFHVLVITPQLEKKPFSEVVHDSYSIPQQSGIRLGKKKQNWWRDPLKWRTKQEGKQPFRTLQFSLAFILFGWYYYFSKGEHGSLQKKKGEELIALTSL